MTLPAQPSGAHGKDPQALQQTLTWHCLGRSGADLWPDPAYAQHVVLPGCLRRALPRPEKIFPRRLLAGSLERDLTNCQAGQRR